jgi:electron transport complex protein RnfE
MDKKLLKETALGGITSNPTFVLVLGMCPTISASGTFLNAFALGVATFAVLICSNTIISALRKVIPDQVRLPIYILIIATFCTVVKLFMERYVYDLYIEIESLIKIIAVNCIILGRAEGFAGKNGVLASLIDGASIGLGFVASMCLLGGIRQLLTEVFHIAIMSQTAGGFLILGLLMAMFNAINFAVKRYMQNKKIKNKTLSVGLEPKEAV